MKLSVIGVVPVGIVPPPVVLVPPPVGAGVPVVGEVIGKEICEGVGWGVDQRSKDRREDNIRWGRGP